MAGRCQSIPFLADVPVFELSAPFGSISNFREVISAARWQPRSNFLDEWRKLLPTSFLDIHDTAPSTSAPQAGDWSDEMTHLLHMTYL